MGAPGNNAARASQGRLSPPRIIGVAVPLTTSDLKAFCFSTDQRTVAQIAESEARKIVRFVHFLIGPIEYLPLTSPAMDNRVRKRHQTEIAELTDSGFEYLCSE